MIYNKNYLIILPVTFVYRITKKIFYTEKVTQKTN